METEHPLWTSTYRSWPITCGCTARCASAAHAPTSAAPPGTQGSIAPGVEALPAWRTDPATPCTRSTPRRPRSLRPFETRAGALPPGVASTCWPACPGALRACPARIAPPAAISARATAWCHRRAPPAAAAPRDRPPPGSLPPPPSGPPTFQAISAPAMALTALPAPAPRAAAGIFWAAKPWALPPSRRPNPCGRVS